MELQIHKLSENPKYRQEFNRLHEEGWPEFMCKDEKKLALGFPSWNEADWKTHKIHSPDAKGTVWKIKKSVTPKSNYYGGSP
jgi:hypothetical protein